MTRAAVTRPAAYNEYQVWLAEQAEIKRQADLAKAAGWVLANAANAALSTNKSPIAAARAKAQVNTRLTRMEEQLNRTHPGKPTPPTSLPQTPSYSPPATKAAPLGGMSWSEIGHGALDLLGFIPGIGNVANGINAVWYFAEGDYLAAGLSAFGAIPGLGNAATGLKVGGRAFGLVAKSGRVIGRVENAAKATGTGARATSAAERIDKS